jgi:hypothetical protein
MDKHLTFSAGLYDRDGDMFDSGVILHVDNVLGLRFSDPDELERFAKKILGMLPEIRESVYWNG